MNPFIFDQNTDPYAAYTQGQRLGSDLATAGVNRFLNQAQANETVQRTQQNAALHPIELEQRRLANQGKQQEMDSRAAEENRKKADAFFKHFRTTGDPEQARIYSGVPPQFVEKFSALSPQDRDKLIQRWAERDAQPEIIKQNALAQREREADERKLSRERELKQMSIRAQIQIAEQRANATITAAKERMSAGSGPSTDKRLVELTSQMMNSLRAAKSAKSPEEAQAFLADANAAQQEIDLHVYRQQQLEIIKAQGRIAGQPNISGVTGGQVPVNPMPQPTGAPLLGDFPPGASQMSSQDKQAAKWAQENPNDPRAALIIKKLKSEGKL